ncbi:MAG TPA: ATP-dependent Clp protease proteolytic subunit, partial [Acidimicrobiales bacterium]|nr:ATP-dependent Clp protease proteolytic subunit [Acidimicrobiales bacterium]
MRDLADETARRLFERRTVLLTGALDGEAATAAAASLMALDADGDDPVTLLVNSPGGPLDAGVAVVDVLDLLGAPVEATCIGQAV